MPVRHYLSRLWLACSLSFYLFVPYLSRYLDEGNRFGFHWNRSDLFSLIFCIISVGTLFFLCYMLFYISGNAVTRKMCEIVFLFLCGIAIMAYISLLVKSVVKSHSDYIITVGILAWILMCGCFVWLLLKYRSRVQAICVALCFILSPLFPIFILNIRIDSVYVMWLEVSLNCYNTFAIHHKLSSSIYVIIEMNSMVSWKYLRTEQCPFSRPNRFTIYPN